MVEYRHFLLEDTRSSRDYVTTTSGGGKNNSPPRPERRTHAEKLLSDLEKAEKKAKARQEAEPAREGLQFIPMVFDESSDSELELQQLENTSAGARIVSAKERDRRREYLVAVPDSDVGKFADKLLAYREKSTRTGKPRHEPLASSISDIGAAELEDYWTGSSDALPPSDEALWWEVWLDTSDTEDKTRREVLHSVPRGAPHSQPHA